MERKDILEELIGLGNGEFLEEVENSYAPEPSLEKIFDRFRRSMMKDVRRHPSSWKSLISTLLSAKDNIDADKLNEILRLEYNLDPSAVGGAEFFTRLGNLLSDYMEEAAKNANGV